MPEAPAAPVENVPASLELSRGGPNFVIARHAEPTSAGARSDNSVEIPQVAPRLSGGFVGDALSGTNGAGVGSEVLTAPATGSPSSQLAAVIKSAVGSVVSAISNLLS